MIQIPAVKLPEGRVFQGPTDLDELFDGVEIEISPRWMGQKIRKNDMYMELGGPKHGYQSYIHVEVDTNEDNVEDGRGVRPSEYEPVDEAWILDGHSLLAEGVEQVDNGHSKG